MPALKSDMRTRVKGPFVCGASNLSKHCSASGDQARLNGERVKQLESKGTSRSLNASSGCEGACVSLRARAKQCALVKRLNSKSTTWNGFRRLCWLLSSWKIMLIMFFSAFMRNKGNYIQIKINGE